MDVREKLVELLAGCPCESDCEGMVGSCPHRKNGNCNEIFKLSYCAVSKLAQHLIANGVTVQEWISVDDMLPEPETDVIAFVGDYIDILSYRYDRRGNLAFMYMDDSGWWHERIRPSVTHWCAMPQPPKGE